MAPCSSAAMCDLSEVPFESGKDILIIFEGKLDAPQALLLPETGDRKVAVQLLNLSQ